MQNIKDVKTFLLDMDGTIYLGNHMIDGALEFLKLLEAQGKSYVFLTNNSSKNREAYQAKLSGLGLEVDQNRIFTSGEATAIYLKNQKKNAKLFVLGTHYLEEELISHGFELIRDRSEIPDFVVLGFDTTLTYEKLWIACDHVREGVPYLATHPDFNCPLDGGKYMPDTGAMIKFIEASTGKLPEVIGKPSHHIVESILDKYQLNKDEVAMVGDRIYTDIQLGVNAGITSVLVYSGETTIADYESSEVKSDYQFASVKEIIEAIR